MDKTLDDIISSRPRGIRRTSARRNPTGKAQIVGSPTPSPANRARAAATINGGAKPAPANANNSVPADKIIVSNLPPDVNEAQVKELFHTMIGPLREVTLHYDANGRSKGVAAVQFQRRGDGNKAYNQYNNRLIDGKRPMKIEIVVDPLKQQASAPLASRVAPAPVAAVSEGPRTGGQRPRRGGRGGGGGGRGGRRNERPSKSVADLDAEMEDYTASNAAPAAA